MVADRIVRDGRGGRMHLLGAVRTFTLVEAADDRPKKKSMCGNACIGASFETFVHPNSRALLYQRADVCAHAHANSDGTHVHTHMWRQ